MASVRASCLLILSVLALTILGNPIIYLSFTHGVLDGPNADVYMNDMLVWSNVPPGSVTAYYPVETINITTYNGNVATQIQTATINPKIAGTQSSFFKTSSVSGMMFSAEHGYESGYMAVYGTFNSKISPVWMTGSYNNEVPAVGSQNSALRFFFCGPSNGVSVRASLFKYSTVTRSYLKYSDQIVDSLGKSMYSILANGTYLVNILNLQDNSMFYSGNITLAATSTYTMTIMGNITVSEYTTPITATLQEDVIPSAANPTSSPTPLPVPVVHYETKTVNFVLPFMGIGVCAAVVIAYFIGRKHSSNACKDDAKPIKFQPVYTPVAQAPVTSREV